MKYIIFIAIGLFFFVLDWLIDKMSGIKRKKFENRKVIQIDNWGRGILLALYVCVFLPIFLDNAFVMKWLFCTLIFVLLLFEAILEWRYLKETNQYISTLKTLFLFIVYAAVVNYFYSIF